MGRLSKEEKEELLKLAKSSKLREDFKKVEDYRKEFFDRRNFNIDEYIKFLDTSNKFINHYMKPFKKIQGLNFKL